MATTGVENRNMTTAIDTTSVVHGVTAGLVGGAVFGVQMVLYNIAVSWIAVSTRLLKVMDEFLSQKDDPFILLVTD